MPKTYTAVPSVAAGDVYTASSYNTYTATNVSNLIVPATAQVRRTTNQGSVVSGTLVQWESALWQNDGTMWSSGDNTKLYLNTDGLYVVTLHISLTASSGLATCSAVILLNAAEVADTNAQANSGTSAFVTNTATINATAGQYLTAYTGLSGGSSISYTGSSSVTRSQTRMTVTWIGRTA